MLAGRRGGKTFLLKEELLRAAALAPYRTDIAYIGPTNVHAKELMWEALEDSLDELGWRYKPMISKQRFEIPGRRKIYVIGAEKISRIRGHALFFAALDELAFWNVDLNKAWRAIRPALSDCKGRAIAATTPDGKGTQAYDWYLNAQRDDSWSVHYWHTIDNPWIDPEEIEEAKRELDEKSFRQEYLASWESFEGLAYYNFDENIHIKKTPKIDVNRKLHLCFDFNVNPTTLLLSQQYGDTQVYIKEYSYPNSSTEKTVEAFCDDFKHLKDSISISIRGDAAGRSRSSGTGFSDYYYIEEILRESGFRYSVDVPAKNPPIVDRVKYVNGWLKPYSGDPRLIVDPACVDLIRDLSSQALNGRHPSDKNNLGHKADAMGYDIYYNHITQTNQKSRTIQL